MKKLFWRVVFDMRNWLANENKKYDGLKEPKRFFLGIGIGLSPFILLELTALFSDHRGYNILGIIWIILIIAMRIWWLEGNLKNYLEDDFIDMTKTLNRD